MIIQHILAKNGSNYFSTLRLSLVATLLSLDKTAHFDALFSAIGLHNPTNLVSRHLNADDFWAMDSRQTNLQRMGLPRPHRRPARRVPARGRAGRHPPTFFRKKPALGGVQPAQ